ncbi:MAG: MgtC/SapB family protein [Candidatus Nomurabacteria bacterium]|nr:MgtC/SapB family protein [Candidatus Nomurabacteria bacterium]
MIQHFFDPQTMDIISRLVVALFLGMIIGMERVWAHKTAGMRTYALVSMGAALFVIISDQMIQQYSYFTGMNPLYLVGNILVGVGFIGTGLIVTRDSKLMGLTTATGLWVSAGIGMAAGFGMTKLAIIATFMTLFIFVVLWFIEEQIKKSDYFKADYFEDNN